MKLCEEHRLGGIKGVGPDECVGCVLEKAEERSRIAGAAAVSCRMADALSALRALYDQARAVAEYDRSRGYQAALDEARKVLGS